MSRQPGYTLMEVFLAIVLVSLVFFALASVFPTALGAMRKGQTSACANNLARQAMEQWQGTDWNTLTTTAWPQVTPVTLEGVKYTVSTSLSTTPDANVDQLDVVVEWDAGGTYGISLCHYSTRIYNVTNPW